MSIAFLVTIFLLMSYAVAFTAIVHCLLHSKYPQAALAWCGVIIMLPFLGAFFYFVFGKNRIYSPRPAPPGNGAGPRGPPRPP